MRAQYPVAMATRRAPAPRSVNCVKVRRVPIFYSQQCYQYIVSKDLHQCIQENPIVVKMGNEALIPHISDSYDSGIDSDEGKNSIMNAVFIKDHEEVKFKSKNIFNKSSIPYEKLGETSKEVEHSKEANELEAHLMLSDRLARCRPFKNWYAPFLKDPKSNWFGNTSFQKTFLSKQSKNAVNGGKQNYGDGVKGSDLNRPLMDSFKSHEQMRLTNVDPSDEKWTAYESDGRDSPQLYEVELTASDEDDSSVLELVIPMQSKIKRYHWLLEFLCFGCLYHYE